MRLMEERYHLRLCTLVTIKAQVEPLPSVLWVPDLWGEVPPEASVVGSGCFFRWGLGPRRAVRHAARPIVVPAESRRGHDLCHRIRGERRQATVGNLC